MRAELIEVQGDQEEFADLIGEQGDLKLPGKNKGENYFLPDSGDSLTMLVKNIRTNGNKTTVKTQWGNTFIFRIQGATHA